MTSQSFSYNKNDVINLAKENDGVILINPDNPSGNFIPFNELLELIDWFKENKKTFIVDESFVDFAENGLDSTLMKEEILNLYSGLIIIKSISKSYGVPGIRLGVIASSNIELIASIKKTIPVWNINSLGEFFFQIIGKYEKVYSNACNKILIERNSLFNELSKNKLLSPIESQANYILCKVNIITSKQLIEILCNSYNILAKDCSEKKGFDGQPYVRLAVRDTLDNQYLIDSLHEIESKVV